MTGRHILVWPCSNRYPFLYYEMNCRFPGPVDRHSSSHSGYVQGMENGHIPIPTSRECLVRLFRIRAGSIIAGVCGTRLIIQPLAQFVFRAPDFDGCVHTGIFLVVLLDGGTR